MAKSRQLYGNATSRASRALSSNASQAEAIEPGMPNVALRYELVGHSHVLRIHRIHHEIDLFRSKRNAEEEMHLECLLQKMFHRV